MQPSRRHVLLFSISLCKQGISAELHRSTTMGDRFYTVVVLILKFTAEFLASAQMMCQNPHSMGPEIVYSTGAVWGSKCLWQLFPPAVVVKFCLPNKFFRARRSGPKSMMIWRSPAVVMPLSFEARASVSGWVWPANTQAPRNYCHRSGHGNCNICPKAQAPNSCER